MLPIMILTVPIQYVAEWAGDQRTQEYRLKKIAALSLPLQPVPHAKNQNKKKVIKKVD